VFSVIVRRLFHTIPALWGTVTLVFFLQRLIPGSPADMVLGPDAPAQQKAVWLAQYGLDQSLGQQYWDYIKNLLQGDFGHTFAYFKPIGQLIRSRFLNTLSLGLVTFGFSLVVSVLLGVASVRSRHVHVGNGITGFSLFGISAPSFVIGPVLIWIFAVKWDLLPLTGHDGLASFILPVVTMAFGLTAVTSRMIRASLQEVLKEDYIRTARAKGVGHWGVLFRHALRNASLPTLTLLGIQLGVLLSGMIITEHIFAWPGLGTLTLEAVQSREYNLVSACVLVMGFLYMMSSLVVDICYQILDPRVRHVG